MCCGFIDAYGLPAAAVEAIELFGARIVEVAPPQKNSSCSAERNEPGTTTSCAP
ncbi:hypothetical protein [Streptomyces sp. NPDC058758]|uniref:hypothetical protein n=1 Tax=Streptomyces sp. NPDC058758 TaxID=3346627 RepID=UPI0036D18303